MLEDSVTGEPREVDIVAESRVGPYTLRLGIECRDHQRPADVTWVEQIAKKHEHLSTDKVVLWSASGFTPAALKKAAALKIDAVSQHQALDTDWKTVARTLIGSVVRYLEVNFESVVDIVRPDGTPERLPAEGRYTLRVIGSDLEGELDRLLHQTRTLPELHTTLLDHAPEGAGTFHSIYESPAPLHLYDGETCLGTLFRMITEYRTSVQTGPIQSKSVRVGDQVFTLATARLPNGTFEFQVVESAETEPVSEAVFLPKAGASG
jgi:hypothetical protein